MKKIFTVTTMAIMLSMSLAFSATTLISSTGKAQVAEASPSPIVEASPVVEQTPAPVIVIQEPTMSEWTDVLSKLGTLQGASVMVILSIVIQALLLATRSSFVKLEASTKWWAVSILSVAVALIAELVKAPSITWIVVLQAVFSGGVLAAVNVYMHQGIKQNFIK